MVMVQEWNFTWPLLSPGANNKAKSQILRIKYEI